MVMKAYELPPNMKRSAGSVFIIKKRGTRHRKIKSVWIGLINIINVAFLMTCPTVNS